MKILITGKNGQVGHALHKSFMDKEVLLLSRFELDLSKPAEISSILNMYKPDLIINAAAYTAVDKAESQMEDAFRVNADAVFEIGKYAAEKGALFYHYSTDYVFDGELNRPYLETDMPRPLNVYGASKLKGEEAVIATGCDYCIFRTSWVYALEGHNFIKTILKLIPQKEELKVVNDQIGTPTSARLIAEITRKALEKKFNPGIYHLTPLGFTSWYDLAIYAVDFFYQGNMSKKIKPILSEHYPFIASRPRNSRLNTDLLQKSLGETLPTWKDEFNVVFNGIKNKQELLFL